MAFIVDPVRFYAEGAVVDWTRSLRLLKIPNVDPQTLRPMVQLRWMIRGDLGLPTEPFKVWARPHSAQGLEQPLSIKNTNLEFFFGYSLITWPNGGMSNVSVDMNASAATSIFSFAGGPLLENINNSRAVAAGNSTVNLAAPIIDGLLLPPGVSVSAVRGIEVNALSKAAGWNLIETVGIPVKQTDWAGIGSHGTPQGLTGSLVDAQTAAVQRLTRGAPPFGWSPSLGGGTAPPWSAPAFPSLVGEVNSELLAFLKGIVQNNAPNQQIAQRITMAVPPPQNSAGETVNATSSDSTVSPLGMTLIAAGTDPFLSLVLGFGTAYQSAPEVVIAVVPRLDYMITARWEKGLNGNSASTEFAAFVPSPAAAAAPPVPANMASEIVGLLKPLKPDLEWRCTSRISWDKLQNLQLFRTASFAAARQAIAPAGATEALMNKRASGGFRPIVINTTDPKNDPIWWRNNAVDRELPIPPSPGNRTVSYGIAVQDIYGQWTPWSSVNEFMQQPDLDQVKIVSARLTPVAPPSGSVCAAKLEVEFLWDWSVRTPKTIQFAGILYPAADHGSPPPSLAIPAGLARTLIGGQPVLDIPFVGATPTPATNFVGLDSTGEKNVGFGPAQGNEGRRYRMTLTGFVLDFAATGHIGMALWARCTENAAPNRVGPWSSNPIVIAASDPRPPVVPVEHVNLASLPDASGESHARIKWTLQPGAGGYFIYETDETQILQALGIHDPTPDQTLDDRLKIIKDNFASIPRRIFHRMNSTAFTTTSTDIALPKGSTAIHCYIVLGISAGQVESTWPADPNALIAVAAPHIMVPLPPLLEAQSFLDKAASPPVYKARLAIKTRFGPRVKKVDIHRVRVDDAAMELDTMGPPVARIQASGGGWLVATQTDTHSVSYIDTVSGIDAPAGSWRRVWYRATAWTELDTTRGGLPGRSPASTAAWVVLPPADPPNITPITVGAGPTPADFIVEWKSAAPLKKTPLGPHILTVRAALSAAPAGTTPIIAIDSALEKLPSIQPATGSGVWITGTATGVTTYRALVRRASINDPIRLAVRITDPIGRVGEALKDVAAGSVLPAPDLSGLVLHKVPLPAPARLILEFASSAPLIAPPGGPYHVKVTGVPAAPGLPSVVDMPVGSVPKLSGGVAPPGLYRQAGPGAQTTYLVVSTAKLVRFVVRISAPDGRFVELTQLV